MIYFGKLLLIFGDLLTPKIKRFHRFHMVNDFLCIFENFEFSENVINGNSNKKPLPKTEVVL